MPPEFFNGKSENSLKASQAHDIWSLAVVFFEMANGNDKFPFNAYVTNESQLKENISIAPTISSNYIYDDGKTNRFIDSLLINNWKNRPTVDQAISLLSQDVLTVPSEIEPSREYRPRNRLLNKPLSPRNRWWYDPFSQINRWYQPLFYS
jgi:serine/threonine protein kinase